MQKFIEHLNNVILKYTPYSGSIFEDNGTLKFSSTVENFQHLKETFLKETFSEVGLELVNTVKEFSSKEHHITANVELLDSRYVKQIIVMRKDLKMRRGKEIAQGSHASLAAVYEIENEDKHSLYYRNWKEHSFAKICLTVNSEEELLKVYNDCKLNAIPTVLITDIGRTEFNGIPTNTCIGIGPFWNCEINKVTSHLKLY